MIDTLSLTTKANPDGTFCTKWQWTRDNVQHALRGGVITTTLNTPDQNDRAILAELSAIHYLLEIRNINANNSHKNLRIKVSFGAIKKALAKGALKKGENGKTDKFRVADWATFLATKYFAVTVDVANKWVDPALENSEEYVLEVFDKPLVSMYSSLLDQDVIITRHAMHRCVGRILSSHNRNTEDDLGDLPDERWTKSWKWLENALSSSDLQRAELVERERKRIMAKYRCQPTILSYQSGKAAFVLKIDHGKYKLVTVLRNDEYYVAIKRPPVQFGDKLVPWNAVAAFKANLQTHNRRV